MSGGGGGRHGPYVFFEKYKKESAETMPKPKLLKLFLYLNYFIGFIIGIIGFFVFIGSTLSEFSLLGASDIKDSLILFNTLIIGFLLLFASTLFVVINLYVESFNNRARHIILGFSILVFLLGVIISNIFILLYAAFALYVLGFNHENIVLFNGRNPSYS